MLPLTRPLATWSLEELERYFDALVEFVFCDGPVE